MIQSIAVQNLPHQQHRLPSFESFHPFVILPRTHSHCLDGFSLFPHPLNRDRCYSLLHFYQRRFHSDKRTASESTSQIFSQTVNYIVSDSHTHFCPQIVCPVFWTTLIDKHFVVVRCPVHPETVLIVKHVWQPRVCFTVNRICLSTRLWSAAAFRIVGVPWRKNFILIDQQGQRDTVLGSTLVLSVDDKKRSSKDRDSKSEENIHTWKT
jgi:hypothetical protein